MSEKNIESQGIAVVSTEEVHAVTPLKKDAFSGLSAFGFTFTVLNTWVGIVIGMGAALNSGGASSLLWGFIYAFLGNLALTMSHGEILAVFPTAAGQYHWAAMLAPPRIEACISWMTGLLNVFSMALTNAGASYLNMVVLVSAILLNYPEWEPSKGQEYGIYAALTTIGAIVSCFIGSRGNRMVDNALTVLSLLGSTALFIVLLATAQPKASGSFVFSGTYNGTGWDSLVVTWLIGILPSAFSFVSFDLVYHISEEMPNPRRDGPKIVNMTILVGGVSGILLILALLFAINDLEALLATPLGLPFAQLVLDATGSKAATTVFLAIIVILLMASARGLALTGGRVLMSLARDGVIPYPAVWEKVVGGEPVYGLLVSLVAALIAGLVQLGPATAFNSLIGSATLFYEVTYMIPAAQMLLGGRKRLNLHMPARTFNLGRWGIAINFIACFFVVENCVMFCFPATMYMWAVSLAYWLQIWFGWARHHFHGPSHAVIIAISNGRRENKDGVVIDDGDRMIDLPLSEGLAVATDVIKV